MIRFCTLLVLSFVVVSYSPAQTGGAIDPGFNVGSGPGAGAQAVAAQPDGKVLVGGSFRTFAGSPCSGLVRINANGTVDPTFAPSFTLPAEGGIFSLTVQSDGKILVAGYFSDVNASGRKSLVRLLPSGAVDTTFDAHFPVESVVFAVAVLPDGSLVAGGTFITVGSASRRALVKLHSDGSVDGTFAPTEVFTDINAAVLTLVPGPNDTVFVGGQFQLQASDSTFFNHVVKVSAATGAVDRTFRPATALSGLRAVSTILLPTDGTVIVAGDFSTQTDNQEIIRQVSASGARIASFSPKFSNTGSSPVINTASLEADGRIVVGGTFSSIDGTARANLARLLPSGAVDVRFSPTSQANGEVTAVALDGGGKVLVVGDFTQISAGVANHVARLLSPTLPPLITTQPATQTITSGNNVRLSVGTETTQGVTFQWFLNDVAIPFGDEAELSLFDVKSYGVYRVRVTNASGSVTSDSVSISVQPRQAGDIDQSFRPAIPLTTGPVPISRLLVPQLDGRFYLTVSSPLGFFDAAGTQLNAGPIIPTAEVFSFKDGRTRSDGYTYIFGGLPGEQNLPRKIVRLTPFGVLDSTFNPPRTIASVADLAFAPNGCVYVGAAFNGSPQNIVRLLPSGDFDPTFSIKAPVSVSQVVALAALPNGTFYASGEFYLGSSANQRSLVRFLADGSLDPAFNCTANTVHSFAVAADGTVWVADSRTLMRLHSDGSRDDSFSVALEQASYVNNRRRIASPSVPAQILPLEDGSIILTDWGNEVNGEPGYGPIRLTRDGSYDWIFHIFANLTVGSRLIDDDAGHWLVVDSSVASVPGAAAAGVVRVFKSGAGASQLANLSVRGIAGTGEHALIAGIVTSGTTSRSLLVRGLGPTLGSLGVSSFVAHPRLDLYSGTTQVATNDQWINPDKALLAAAASRLGAFGLRDDLSDAALLRTLAPGLYSAQLASKDGVEGIALVEAYDDGAPGDTSVRLVNLSARGYVRGGEQVMIGGFVIRGTGEKQLLVRAVGPSLVPFGVTTAMPNPRLRLVHADQTIAENDNWSTALEPTNASGAAKQVGAFPLLTGSKDAALWVTVSAGVYSVVVDSADSVPGVVLMEIYEVSQ